MQRLFEFIVKNKLTSQYTDNTDCVDLDLPSGTLWATCNIGASKPEEYGGYYQWGGLEDMSNKNCDWDTVPFNDAKDDYDKDAWDKCKNKVLDNNDNLKLEYDVAYKESKGMLRMPTKDEVKELVNNTIFEWCELNDVKGRKFISKKDKSKWIFIPNAGTRINYINYSNGADGSLWSSSINNSGPEYAHYSWNLYNYKYGTSVISNNRCCGLSVRGVKI